MAYSDQFLEQKSGIIKLVVPTFNYSYETITGILQDDPQIQMGNTWAPISEFQTALDPLQDIQQVIQTENISNFVSASGMAWKGTPHIKVNCTFYLINFNAKSNAGRQVRFLSELCSLETKGSTQTRVHGGYKLDLFQSNENLTNKDLKDISNNVLGTVTMVINSGAHTVVKGLLAQSVQVQPSTVSVANGQPLYYLVSVSFTGYRSPIQSDFADMYGGL